MHHQPTITYQEYQMPAQTLISYDLKKDDDLEKNPSTSAQNCLNTFLEKGGTFQCVLHADEVQIAQIHLSPGNAIYPICSGGVCRSQTLWAMLQPFSNQIVLFPPHAARYGWDPYNGRINRYLNYEKENWPDEYPLYFGHEKSMRFGFENVPEWQAIESLPSLEGLNEIAQFYNLHYYGKESSWEGKKGKNRIYIAFANNAHVTLHRLNQANDRLEGVTVIAIDTKDLVTRPPAFLQTTPRSVAAYEHFLNLLSRVLDLTDLKAPQAAQQL